MTKEKRDQLREILAAAAGGIVGPVFYVAVGDESPPASAEYHRLVRCETRADADLVAVALKTLEELLDDLDERELAAGEDADQIDFLEREVADLRPR